MNKNCNDCKNLKKSIYLKLEDEILYNIWCKFGDIEAKTCDNFTAKNKSK